MNSFRLFKKFFVERFYSAEQTMYSQLQPDNKEKNVATVSMLNNTLQVTALLEGNTFHAECASLTSASIAN